MSFSQEMKDFIGAYKSSADSQEASQRANYYAAGAAKKNGSGSDTDPDGIVSKSVYDEENPQPKAEHGWIYKFGQWFHPTQAPYSPNAYGTSSAGNDSAVDDGTGGSGNGNQYYDQTGQPTQAFSRGGYVKAYAEGGAVDDSDLAPVAVTPQNSAVPVAPPPAAAPAPDAPPTAPMAAPPSAPPAPAQSAVPTDDSSAPTPAPAPSPSPDGSTLGDALHGGIMWLQRHLGLDQSNNAVPDQQQVSAGTQDLRAGKGAFTSDDVKAMAAAVDHDKQLTHAQVMIRGMEKGYQHYMAQGDPDRANKFAAMIIQYSTHEASLYGTQALHQLQQGDTQGAVHSLAAASANLPDGKNHEAKVNPDGTATVVESDAKTGKVTAQHTLNGQQLYQLAMGLSNKSMAYGSLMDAAAATKGVNLPQSQAYTDAVAKLDGAGGAAPVTPAGNTLSGIGVLPGKLNINDSIAPKVPQGAARPLAPGEFITNPNGSWSSEITTTVDNPALNSGRPTIIPTLWLVNGKPTRVSEDQAVDLASKSGLTFTSYNSMKDAEAASIAREAAWQKVQPGQTGGVAPLWQSGTGGAPSQLPAYMGNYAQMMSNRESSNNPAARNGDSVGLYQIQSAAWKDATGHNPMVNGADERLDPAKNTAVFKQITQQNEAAFKNAFQRAPTPAELSVMHQQGATGGMGLLRAAATAPNASAAAIVGDPAKLTRNGVPANATAQQAVQAIQGFYAKGAQGAAPAQPQGPMALQPALSEDMPAAAPQLPDKPTATSVPAMIQIDPKDTAGMSPQERVAYAKTVATLNNNKKTAFTEQQGKFNDDMKGYTQAVAAAKVKASSPAKPLPMRDRGDALTALATAKSDYMSDPNNALKGLQPGSQKAADDVAYGLFTHNDTTPARAYQATAQLLSMDAKPDPKKPGSMIINQTFTPHEIPGTDGVKIVFRTGDTMVIPKNTFAQIAAARGNELFVQRQAAIAAAKAAAASGKSSASGWAALKAAGNIAGNAASAVGGAAIKAPIVIGNAVLHPVTTAGNIGMGALRAIDSASQNRQ
jgi:hypothetical protein